MLVGGGVSLARGPLARASALPMRARRGTRCIWTGSARRKRPFARCARDVWAGEFGVGIEP